MRRVRLLPVFLLAAATGAAAGRTGASAQARPRTPWRVGVDTARYTEEQAAAGRAVFVRACANCHETKDLSGADFRTKWKGQTVLALFEQIRTTMPDGNPGTLPREDYAATVAYILKLNGMPVGTTPLAPDSAALAAQTLELPPPTP